MKDTARIIITESCNLQCSYCCNKNQQVQKLFHVCNLEDIYLARYRNVCVTGGEPFLRPGIITQVVKAATAHGCNVYLYTNGTLLTVRRARSVLDAGVNTINVSIHEDVENEVARIASIWSYFPDRIRIKVPVSKIHEADKIIKKMFKGLYSKGPALESFTLRPGAECVLPNEDIFVLKGA